MTEPTGWIAVVVEAEGDDAEPATRFWVQTADEVESDPVPATAAAG